MIEVRNRPRLNDTLEARRVGSEDGSLQTKLRHLVFKTVTRLVVIVLVVVLVIGF